ncbi:hypothetical protein PMALA_063590 [Plasmodium malariae]|uniref:Uncharacterized protein n=1 Tax=Plasmodium malariae TaxID=5858 RepID=A0A1A8WZN8_PLAMA|nr:hypothetical protein PMALA_063590 [Plasmodium malariae]
MINTSGYLCNKKVNTNNSLHIRVSKSLYTETDVNHEQLMTALRENINKTENKTHNFVGDFNFLNIDDGKLESIITFVHDYNDEKSTITLERLD